MTTRTWSLALLLLPFLAPRSATPDEVTFSAEEGTELVRTFETSIDLALDEMSITYNGEEVPTELQEDMEWGITSEQLVVVHDVYGPLGDGRPRSLVRTFETAEGVQTFSASTPDGDEEQETPLMNALEGRVVAFTWDDDEEEYAVEFADDEGDDGEELLPDLREDMDLRAWLPDGAVEEGDSWEIELDDFELVDYPGGIDLDAEDSTERERELQDLLDENTTGEVLATYQGTRDEDGTQVAVIFITATLETEAEQTAEEEGVEITTTTAAAHDVEGELLWDLEAGHLFGLELEGSLQWSMEEAASGEDEAGNSFEFVQLTAFDGDYSIVVSVERE